MEVSSWEDHLSMGHLYHGELLKPILAGGSKHLEKHESQLG
jgi:hypothetical protein